MTTHKNAEIPAAVRRKMKMHAKAEAAAAAHHAAYRAACRCGVDETMARDYARAAAEAVRAAFDTIDVAPAANGRASWANLAITVANGDTHYVTGLTPADVARRLVNLRETSGVFRHGLSWDAPVVYASMEVDNDDGFIKCEVEASTISDLVDGARRALSAVG